MAYGAIAAPPVLEPLPTLAFALPNERTLTTFPVTGADAPTQVLQYMYKVFSDELEGGKTYPQQGPISYEAFLAYFFASTTIVGIVSKAGDSTTNTPEELQGLSLAAALEGRDLDDALGGCYYVKPNYPGRSSHICNGGFIVPPAQRGRRIGIALGTSYLQYAKKLGYRGSVFNLVFKNNVASLRIWDQLGFERVGLIPAAGRLKTGPNGTEEYVDAVVVYKSLV